VYLAARSIDKLPRDRDHPPGCFMSDPAATDPNRSRGWAGQNCPAIVLLPAPPKPTVQMSWCAQADAR
jgi:hypothetical protein